MASIDVGRARPFVRTFPRGRWTACKDFAEAGGNVRGAQALGDWLRRDADRVARACRVLTVDGAVPEEFRTESPWVPVAASVRERLRGEGVVIEARAGASHDQRFTVADWTG